MLARIADFIHRMGSVAGIQIAHAGRKGELRSLHGKAARASSIPRKAADPVSPPARSRSAKPIPRRSRLDEPDIRAVVDALVAAASRAIAAGFRVIELHSAHGYLLHEFLSPLSNKRTDRYGGSSKIALA